MTRLDINSKSCIAAIYRYGTTDDMIRSSRGGDGGYLLELEIGVSMNRGGRGSGWRDGVMR